MAQLVAAVGTSHRPGLPAQIAKAPGTVHDEPLFARVRESLQQAEPEVIFVLTTDHCTNFYHRNMPAIAVGVFDHASGPERNQSLPPSTVRGDRDVAFDLLRHSRGAGFDLALVEEAVMDHSVLVPLHFLTPAMDIPIVPIYVNGLVSPFVTGQRCLELGGMLAEFVGQLPGSARVALLASGSLSIDVSGPRMGITDDTWMRLTTDHLRAGKYDDLAAATTERRLMQAGTASGEFLNWIVVTGALGGVRPDYLEATVNGNGYAAWELVGSRDRCGG